MEELAAACREEGLGFGFYYSHNYQEFPIGWLSFPEPGEYRVAVSCLEGTCETSSLKAIRFTPVQ